MTHSQKVSAAISQMAEHWKEIERLENLLSETLGPKPEKYFSRSDLMDMVSLTNEAIQSEYKAYRAICKERLLLEREWGIKDSKPVKEIPVRYPYHAATEHNTEMYNEYKKSA